MPGPILMHGDPLPLDERAVGAPGRGERIWLIAGTGEGPALAKTLLERGWRLRVSLVSRAAAMAYDSHPRQELMVGAIGGPEGPAAGVAAELAAARRQGDPFAWVIDATHPFATRISAALARTCPPMKQPLLRLLRPDPPAPGAILLADLAGLGAHCRPGERLLLAIGSRRLAEAVAASPQAIHHARLLPSGDALGTALAAGLPPRRVAPLRPTGNGAIERALCLRWGITAVLCRRSGSTHEQHWQNICTELGLRLLLLERPDEPQQMEALPMQQLVARLGQSGGAG